MSTTAERRRIVRDSAVEARVSPLELFFDLVFVFAITQVTAFMADDLTFGQIGRGLIVLALIWWAWGGYAWLTNEVDPDRTGARLVMFGAMAAMLVVALVVPESFTDDGGLTFAGAYFAVRIAQAGLFWVAAAGDAALRRNVWTLVISSCVGPAVIVVATLATEEGTARDLLWLLALLLDYGVVIAAPASGWHISPGHFAERFGLIIIIALGESIVAMGVGAKGLEIDAALIAAAVLTVTISGSLWWAYFDVVARVAERHFREAPPGEQQAIARDSYGLLHLPMIAGIVLFALGVKKATGHLDEPLKDPAAVALCGGLALYSIAHVLFRLRNIGTLAPRRLVLAAISLALIPVATSVDALVALAALAAVWVAYITYEVNRFRDARARLYAAEAEEHRVATSA
jgi:low temperature requirement protein LtrA